MKFATALTALTATAVSATTTLGDRLDVTWPKFSGLPVTTADSVKDGWSNLDSTCGEFGIRQRLNGDHGLTLMFNNQGHLAGVQASAADITNTNWEHFPDIIEVVDGLYTVSVYFEEPSTICSSGNGDKKSIGDRLLLRSLSGKVYNDLPIVEDNVPHGETDLWDLGSCFVSMGTHYWGNISTTMDCTYFYPVGLMYTRGSLRTFLFALGSIVGDSESSPRWEHPPQDKLNLFFRSDNFPTCLKDDGMAFSTMHFFTYNPIWNNCIGSKSSTILSNVEDMSWMNMEQSDMEGMEMP